MKILVLGGHGFVGSHVLTQLSAKGFECVAASRRTGLDMLRPEELKARLGALQPDFIVNCAAYVGSLNFVSRMMADILRVNASMIINLYDAVAQAAPRAVIINPVANCAFPGSLSVYKEDDVFNGPVHASVMAYGFSRRLLLVTAHAYARQYQLKSYNLFVPNMYGPNDSTDPDKAHALNALISKFVKAEYDGVDTIPAWGTGVAIREWLYAGDFAGIVCRLIEQYPVYGLDEPINVAQSFGLSVKELVEIIQKQMRTPFHIAWDANMPDGALKKVMDDARFRKVFPGFAFTPLESGISATIDYYRSVLPYETHSAV
jgi:GDP-L-fucose synthase